MDTKGFLARFRDIFRRSKCDLVIVAIFSVTTFVGSYLVGRQIGSVVFQYGNSKKGGYGMRTKDIWFDADLPNKEIFLTVRRAAQSDFTERHPLYWPGSFVAGYLLRHAALGLGLGPGLPRQVRAFTAAMALCWIAAMYTLFRLITRRRLDAILLSLLAMSSAAATFWLVLPEVFGWGSVTIALALCLAALADRRPRTAFWYVVASALTLSMTITNWMVGIFVTFAAMPWRRAAQLTINAFFVVSVLWGVQKLFIPDSEFFLTFPPEDKQFVLNPASGGALRVSSSFFFHTIVMPEIKLNSTSDPLWYGMTTQSSRPGSGTKWGKVAVILWSLLLAIGVYALATLRQYVILRLALAGSLLSQLALHLLFGTETFLYSVHFVPLLLSIAALGTLTKFRNLTLALIVALIVTCGVNNGVQLTKAIRTVDAITAMVQSYYM
jgi:hypothetical protein